MQGKSGGLRSHRSRVQSSAWAPFIVALSKSQIHINNICSKANRTLGFLRRNLFSCPQDVKEAAYKGLVRPVIEYGSSVWDPHTKCLQEELEKVQNRATRFVTRNYSHMKWVCMCRPRLKRRALTELIKLKKWVLSELKER